MLRRKYLVLSALLLGCGGISTTSRDDDAGAGAGGSAAGSSSSGSRAGSEAHAGSGGTTGVGTSGASTAASGSPWMGGAPVGAGGGVSNPPGLCGGAPVSQCRGIKTGMACLPEGQECPCMMCGLADLGRRHCQCSTGFWTCTACEHPGDIFPPDPLYMCTDQADKLPCTDEGVVCQGAPGNEVCMCYADDEGQLVWDCDKPPSNAPW
jgi:hypothetical protein